MSISGSQEPLALSAAYFACFNTVGHLVESRFQTLEQVGRKVIALLQCVDVFAEFIPVEFYKFAFVIVFCSFQLLERPVIGFVPVDKLGSPLFGPGYIAGLAANRFRRIKFVRIHVEYLIEEYAPHGAGSVVGTPPQNV